MMPRLHFALLLALLWGGALPLPSAAQPPAATPPAAPASTPAAEGDGKGKKAAEPSDAHEDNRQRKLSRQQRMDRLKRLGSFN